MIVKSLEHLNSLSQKVAEKLSKNDCIFLIGEIGVGKTTFARYLINYLQEKNGEKITEVLSPTFNLLYEYDLKRIKIMHYDLYRISNEKELEQLGYNIVIYPVTTQRLAMKNVEDGLRDIYVNGHQNNIIDKMQTRKRLYELVDYEKYNSLDEKIYNFSTEGHE